MAQQNNLVQKLNKQIRKIEQMNTKKKIQRNSYKKLISTTRRPDLKPSDEFLDRQRLQGQNSSFNPMPKSSSKNRSAQKILSVYQSSKAKFKIGKFLNASQRQQRIKTENDEFNKTKTNYHKINSVRKIDRKQKDEKFMLKNQKIGSRLGTSTKGPNDDKTDKNRNFMDLGKQRTFNKRLHLNSQLFQSLNNGSLEKYEVPQTSKHEKKSNISFRKEHDSYRGADRKTALQKYISQSLENLECPVKKKNSKNVSKQNQQEVVVRDSKQKFFTKTGSNKTKLFQQGPSSIQKRQFPTDSYEKCIFDGPFDNNTDQVKQARTIRSPDQRHYPEKSHRRLKTQTTDSIQKVQIKSIQKVQIKSIQKIQIKWQRKKKNPYDMSNQQMETFGDRFPDGYDKIKLLGRGGFSLVWLGEHKKSKKKYAIKQIITQSNHQTHKKEIWFGEYFFDFGGVPRAKFLHHPGIKNLVKLYYYFVNKKDTWLLYQKCGDSLGNALYQLKGQNYNNQKMYRIHYKQFYTTVRNNQNQLRRVMFDVARALQLLAENNIVHSDLKTENILVKIKNEQDEGKTVDAKGSGTRFTNSVLEQVKLIDYGSSFQFSNLRQFSMATPQYMAPQILNFILYQNQLQYIPKLFEYVQDYHYPWVIDIWSLGCVILQIISGIPLWMSLKTIVRRKGKQLIRYGLFAVKGRTFDKIIKKQLQVVQNLDRFLLQENYSDMVPDQDIKYLLKRMLALNPAKRISPGQIIDYLNKKNLEKP